MSFLHTTLSNSLHHELTGLNYLDNFPAAWQNNLPTGLHCGNKKLWAIVIGTWIHHRDYTCNRAVDLQGNNLNVHLKNKEKCQVIFFSKVKFLHPTYLLQTSMRMVYLEILIRKGATINWFISSTIMMNNVTALNHETWYYPMKWYSFVMKFYTTGILSFLPYTICNTHD